ncbi:calcium permease family membrane transporter [Anopheles sinensis]|uniref:Calcium permease family membrane transporter n=1 Tax=Anopheles sinensis TaxID=74873 RepID=A0A084VK46_ANOSI|nr:calcium permease family membrane transporter [Anopheles sinensis]
MRSASPKGNRTGRPELLPKLRRLQQEGEGKVRVSPGDQLSRNPVVVTREVADGTLICIEENRW